MTDESDKKPTLGFTTQLKLGQWINKLKEVARNQAKEPREKKSVPKFDHIDQIHQEMKEESDKNKAQMRQYLENVQAKTKQKEDYIALSLREKRLLKSLESWYGRQKGKVADGILELHFRNNVFDQEKFEPILEDYDSTIKIKKMKGSDKLKEMLLVFKRGKKLFLSFYSKDLKADIYTFMFTGGKIQANQKCREVDKVIRYFRMYLEKKSEKY